MRESFQSSSAITSYPVCRVQGKQVVRLKGGCPSVFSRVASELRALEEANLEWELVPGVSSVLAAPLLAGELTKLNRPDVAAYVFWDQLC